MLFAMSLGLIVALPALSDSASLKWINRIYVEVIRSVPVLVLLLWVYYGMLRYWMSHSITFGRVLLH
ncbi:putative amino acid ABC transporter, permease protein [Vibrio sp. JCM 18904]|nr:putative amino acid ABC transporter, permease protein [Vibrio sp. JCM 18904]